MTRRSGRHFLQIPGPTNVPDRILRAIDRPTIDHRSADFGKLARSCLEGMQPLFGTRNPVIVFPASGTGAWEAALVNTLSPGDQVLCFETGHFARLWAKVASNLGLNVELVSGDWRHGVDPVEIHARLANDRGHRYKAVLVVHNETSAGITSNIPAVRHAIDDAKHPALFMVDAISSLACIDYRHDDWGVDVTVGASQKGLMLPPGLAFNAVGPKAMQSAGASKLPKSYWRWDEMLASNAKGFFPFTPATNMLYGLLEALNMMDEEGLANVFHRHHRLAEATRTAVRAWGLEILALNPAEYSDTITAVMLPEDCSESAFRALVLERFNMSLGSGLGKTAGRVFRIGHLGDFNELMLAGTLAGIEMGLELAGLPYRKGGVTAALDYLTTAARQEPTGAAPDPRNQIAFGNRS